MINIKLKYKYNFKNMLLRKGEAQFSFDNISGGKQAAKS